MRFLLSIVFFTVFFQARAQVSIAQEQQLITVTVQPVSELLVMRELRAPAEVMALNRAIISTEQASVIKKIHVDVGQEVKVGELMLELEKVDYELAYRSVKAVVDAQLARIDQAERRLKRAEDLGKKSFVSTDDLMDRQTDLLVLKAELKKLQVDLSVAKRALAKCDVRAPFTGVVQSRFAQVGAYVTPAVPLFEFVQTQKPYVEARIPSSLSDSLLKANDIRFKYNQYTSEVSLDRMSGLIESASGMQLARFSIIKGLSSIGATGELIWFISDGLLPADMIVERNGELGIFVAEDSVARFKLLDTAQEGRPVAIDLSPELLLVVDGKERLQDGDLIEYQQ